MSKILTKQWSSFLRNNNEVYSLKSDMILYDKIGIIDLEKLELTLEFNLKTFPGYKYVLNEFEYLKKHEFLVDIYHLCLPGAVDLNQEALDLAEEVRKKHEKVLELEKIDKLQSVLTKFEYHDLTTRLWTILVNISNRTVYAIPSLTTTSTFETPHSSKENGYNILLRKLPVPTDRTSWEQIIEFKKDTEAQLKIASLRNWINEIPDNFTFNEIEDKIEYLYKEYTTSLKRHKLETQLISIKTVVNAVPKALSELVGFTFDGAADAYFQIAEQKVNYNNYDRIKKTNGNELAYIEMAKSKFND